MQPNPAAETSPQRIVTLPFGHLPVLSYFAIHAGLPASEARQALDVMRRSLRHFGPTNTVREMLKAYGFRWTDAPSIEEDVAAVRDALVDEPARALVTAVLAASREEEERELARAECQTCYDSRYVTDGDDDVTHCPDCSERGEGANGSPDDDLALRATGGAS